MTGKELAELKAKLDEWSQKRAALREVNRERDEKALKAFMEDGHPEWMAKQMVEMAFYGGDVQSLSDPNPEK